MAKRPMHGGLKYLKKRLIWKTQRYAYAIYFDLWNTCPLSGV